MPTDDHLHRPYATLTPEDHTRRLSIRVRMEDWNTFSYNYPVPGALETIVTTLIHGIANELRANGFNGWTPANQRRFVTHIRRCATLAFIEPSVPPTESTGGKAAGGASPKPSQEPAEALRQDDGGDEGQEGSEEAECDSGQGRKPFS